MEAHAIVARALTAVFARLATPERLGEWLPEVVQVERADDQTGDTGSAFAAILEVDGGRQPARGEVIALEPPATVAYRLFLAGRIQVVRATCVACDAGTRVGIAVAGDQVPLAVDLAGLARAMALLPEDNAARGGQTAPAE